MNNSKLEAKKKAKAQHKAKMQGKSKEKSVDKEESQSSLNIKKFPVLSTLLIDKRNIIPIEQLSKLKFQTKVQLISELSQYIIMSPENNIVHIQTLLHLSEDDNIFVAKAGLISTAEVFKDVAPLYEINEDKVKEELKKQISKEDRKLLMFELTFFQTYRKYVNLLTELLRLKPKKYINSLGASELPTEEKQQYEEVCREYSRVALLCLSDLINSLYHMNFRREIANLVASKLKSFDEDTRQVAVKTANQFFADQNPAVFEIKLAFVQTLAKTFGSTPEAKLPDDFLDILNNLSLQSNIIIQETEEEKKQAGVGSKNIINKKRKGQELDEKVIAKLRQEKKLRKELKEELKEAEATIDPKKVENLKNEILNKVFYIYFKVLKYPKLSKFFNVAMNGILKFIHLISSTILGDLIDTLGECGDKLRVYHLKNLLESKTLLHSRIACIFTSIEIINELGKVVELDDKEAILTLYQLFIDITKHPKICKVLKKKDQLLLVKTLQKILITKRQLSLETTASFVKIFLTCGLKIGEYAPVMPKTLLFFVKLIMQKYTTLTRLLEEENEGFGLDLYNTSIEDPQATNALRTYIVGDLQKLIKKYPNDSEVQILAKKTETMERLPTHLASLTPLEFFRRYIGDNSN